MEELPDILCINCEDMININKLEAHSLICIAPSSQVIKIISSSIFYQIQFRLSKIKSAIESIYFYELHKYPTIIKSFLELLIKKIIELLQLTEPSIDSIDALTEIASEIRGISSQLSIKFMIYAERLKVLCSEKTHFFIEEIRKNEKHGLTRELLIKRYEINTIRFKSLHFHQKSNNSESRQSSIDNIEAINSQNDSRITFRSSMSSALLDDEGSKSIQFNNFEGNETDKSHENRIKVTNDLKKYFYSMCLITKLSFSSRDPAQYIQIHELYKKIIENDIPIENWEEFIKEEFQNPDRWVNLNVIPKKLNKK